jgi:hypothetical protein
MSFTVFLGPMPASSCNALDPVAVNQPEKKS